MRQDVQMMCTRHIGKNIAIENGVDGAPLATAARVDAHEPTLIEDRAKTPRMI